MTKKRVLEILTRLWLFEMRTLEKVREARGPEAWGDCPADLVARYHVGRRDAFKAAMDAVKGARPAPTSRRRTEPKDQDETATEIGFAVLGIPPGDPRRNQ